MLNFTDIARLASAREELLWAMVAEFEGGAGGGGGDDAPSSPQRATLALEAYQVSKER